VGRRWGDDRLGRGGLRRGEARGLLEKRPEVGVLRDQRRGLGELGGAAEQLGHHRTDVGQLNAGELHHLAHRRQLPALGLRLESPVAVFARLVEGPEHQEPERDHPLKCAWGRRRDVDAVEDGHGFLLLPSLARLHACERPNSRARVPGRSCRSLLVGAAAIVGATTLVAATSEE
jgi:hypothetical protein